ncbi:MAG: response regulator [Dehalococcoidia bacterium]
MPATATTTRPVRYVAEPPPRTPVATTSVAPLPRSWGEPFGVLLVEDNADEIVVVQHTLKRAGLTDRPHVVRDGRAALDVLLGPNCYAAAAPPLTEVPDVVLLDLGLPKISGLNVLRRIKEHARVSDIPVVVLSGADDEGTAQMCMNLGANMYIVKPISCVHVMNIIVAVQKHWLAVENFRWFDIEWRERLAASDARM